VRRCVLHIGQPKTGSSSIQRTLNGARKRLLEQHGIGYFPKAINHRFVKQKFESDFDDAMLAKYLGQTVGELNLEPVPADLFEQFETYLETTNSRVEVISSEGLGRIPAPAVNALRDWLARWFDELQVIAYVRGFWGGMSSRVQQRVKGGETFEGTRAAIPQQSACIDTFNKDAIVSPSRFLFGPYIDAFGAQNVTLRQFSPDALRGGDVVEDFFQSAFGMASDRSGPRTLRTNDALPATAVHMLETINRHVPVWVNGIRNPARATGIIQVLRTFPCSRKFVAPDICWDHIRMVARDEAHWLYEFSDGAIDFRDEPTPVTAEPVEWNQAMSDMSIMLHQQVVRAEEANAKRAIQAALAKIMSGRGAHGEPDIGALKRGLRRTTDRSFLDRTARRLRKSGLDDLHSIASRRLEFLSQAQALGGASV